MIFLLTTFLIGIFNLNFDAWMIKNHREINHVLHTAIVGFLWVVSMMYLRIQGLYYIYESGVLFFIAAALRWFYHDFFLNVFRNKTVNYPDNENILSLSRTDDFLIKTKMNQYQIKLNTLGLGILLYLIPHYL